MDKLVRFRRSDDETSFIILLRDLRAQVLKRAGPALVGDLAKGENFG
jgi:hypothetical protein